MQYCWRSIDVPCSAYVRNSLVRGLSNRLSSGLLQPRSVSACAFLRGWRVWLPLLFCSYSPQHCFDVACTYMRILSLATFHSSFSIGEIQVCLKKFSMMETKYWLQPRLTFCTGPHTSIWITSSLSSLRLCALGKGSRCYLPNIQGSKIWSFRPLNFGKLKTSCFNCMSYSREKLMWPNRLCYKSMSNSTFYTLAYMAVPTSLVSRINILPSLRPCAMSWPPSSMKYLSRLNCTCIPWSTIWTDTKFLVIVGTCSTFFMPPF